jgi:putative hydrolase of the HAD superfamily
MKANSLTSSRGIGFDLGETLIFYRDTPLSWTSLYPNALRAVASACAHEITEQQLVSAKAILSRYNTRIAPRTTEVAAETIFTAVLQAWELEVAGNLAAAVESFFSFFQQNMAAYSETVGVLTALHERGIPTGILTDVPYGMPRSFVERDIQRAGIAELFGVLLTSVEVGTRKPEPAGYRALANRLGVQPGAMMYVGNEPKDVIGARQAGAVAVLLDREKAGGDHGQQFTIETLADIGNIFSSLHS